MFRIANITKQIFNASRNIQQAASASITSMVKYCSQSKGYIEDVADEFYFESFTKILPQQSVSKDHFRATASNFQGTNKLGSIGSYNILEASDTRKLIYARFADEIVAKSQNAEESKSLETKSHDTKDHKEACSTYNITEEFKIFKEQGYDFAATREVLENCNQDTNQNQEANQKNLVERMKELSISGFFSSYAGQPDFRENLKKMSIQKELVINEFMAIVAGKVEELEEYSTELLG